MIRFSAALVAVAIGVLIGGIATSKLLLVYIAIVVSAVALLALAVGVVVKREELFGEGQGLVPAGAGAAPVQSARTGERQDQPKPVASAAPSAPFPGPAAGYGSAFDGTPFGGTSQAPPPPAASPSAPHQAPDGPGRDRVADPAPPWEAQSARDQWSSSPLPGRTTADPAPDWMPGGRAASDPVGQAPPTAPSPVRPLERSAPSRAGSDPVGQAPPTAPSPVPPLSPAPSSAGPEPASPNWFAPRARPAEAAPAAAEAPADPAPADADDDWPARYSWLDDEADEGPGEKGQGGAPADQAVGVDAADHSPPKAGQPEPSATPASATLASATLSAETAVPGAVDAGSEPVPGEPGLGDAEPVSANPESAEPEPESAEPQAESAGSEPPSGDAKDQVPGDDLVAVLRGVPRYHQPDCVLIRFMPEGDVQRLPAAQAKADGCTPCAACQPAE